MSSVHRLLTDGSQFGAGSRTCIGKNINLLEMSKVLPQIVRALDFEFEQPDQEWDVFCSWFVWPEYNCRIHPRQAAGEPKFRISSSKMCLLIMSLCFYCAIGEFSQANTISRSSLTSFRYS